LEGLVANVTSIFKKGSKEIDENGEKNILLICEVKLTGRIIAQ